MQGDVHAALQVKGSDIKGSRQDSAIKSYEAALSIPNPSDVHGIHYATILLKLGNAYMKFDQPQKALHYFTKCTAMTSDTLVLLLDAVKVQRSESPLSWIDEDEECKLKESMEEKNSLMGTNQLKKYFIKLTV